MSYSPLVILHDWKRHRPGIRPPRELRVLLLCSPRTRRADLKTDFGRYLARLALPGGLFLRP